MCESQGGSPIGKALVYKITVVPRGRTNFHANVDIFVCYMCNSAAVLAQTH